MEYCVQNGVCEEKQMAMYFLTPMCFICLKSKSNHNVVNVETLKKLLYCIEKTEDFILPISNQTRICNDCLNKLFSAFHFKNMCLKNIVQFKDYLNQLKQATNNPCKALTIDLNDIYKSKGTLEDNYYVDLTVEPALVNQVEAVLIKKEILDDVSQKGYFIEDQVLLHKEEITEKADLQNYSNVLFANNKITSKSANLQQVEVVFIKTEILDENNLQSSESQRPYSNEELKLLLHKEETLDDVYEEEILEGIQYQDASEKNEVPFTCTMCGKHFTLKRKFMRHTRNHAKKSYSCDKCQKCFTRKYALKTHILTHMENKPHSCEICGKGFTANYILNRHKLSHAAERPFVCPICGKGFVEKRHLNQHVLIHSNERPYPCSVCEKSFVTKCNLSRHMIIHTNERPYSCSICTKSFIQKSYLRKHMLIHTKERPHSCAICAKSFAQKSNLNQHIMLHHSNKRSFPCSICKKSFTHKSILNQHIVVHSNEQPHSCSICMKSFTHKSSLKEHILVHSNERLYSCLICKKSFFLKRYLKQHVLTHSNHRPYSCPVCAKRFSRPSHLKKHALIHSNESPQ